LLCAFPGLCTVLLASNGATPAQRASTTTDPASERGVPALFFLCDLDGDGRLDLAAVSEAGTLQLLSNAGGGRFEDVTDQVGLSAVRNAALALWADYDADGRVDLFVAAREGASRLFHNEGGAFVDMSAASGLVIEGAVQAAQWLDLDGDARLDLFVVTAEKTQLFRGLEGGFFEMAELPLTGAANAQWPGGVPAGPDDMDVDGLGTTLATPSSGKKDGSPAGGLPGSLVRREGGLGLSGGGITGPPPVPFSFGCMPAIANATGIGCIQAARNPGVPGRLYPLTQNLFVAASGNVGVGTLTPVTKLVVKDGTLTLNPLNDQALDVSTGSIYKSGALFIHTKGGTFNTAIGQLALASVTTGSNNTASGDRALLSNTTGYRNTASGSYALQSNVLGNGNTATGTQALFSNAIGSDNTASGNRALFSNTTGNSNTASGAGALYSNDTGSGNTASGLSALRANTASNNTAFGAESLRSNTTGVGNTASGFDALRSNTTGGSNTASGNYSLFFNSTGNRNTATGFNALKSNTIGSDNTAVGRNALYSNSTGSNNTASGAAALSSNTTGAQNTASGFEALKSNTTGFNNTASGGRALDSNTSGARNTAIGQYALHLNTTADNNTAIGTEALRFNTGSRNTANGDNALRNNTTGSNNNASGFSALRDNTTGSSNIAIGNYSGVMLTTGSNNIAIGNLGVTGEGATIRIGSGIQTRAFIAGISGSIVSPGTGTGVFVDSAGQLGTVVSSRRFKKDIADMGELTDRLLELRPVVFHYKQEPKLANGNEAPLEYGLIAEEVAEIFPDLVIYDEKGLPFTVKYHLLSAMLLNELERLKASHEDQLGELQDANSALEARVASLESLKAEFVNLQASLRAQLENH